MPRPFPPPVEQRYGGAQHGVKGLFDLAVQDFEIQPREIDLAAPGIHRLAEVIAPGLVFLPVWRDGPDCTGAQLDAYALHAGFVYPAYLAVDTLCVDEGGEFSRRVVECHGVAGIDGLLQRHHVAQVARVARQGEQRAVDGLRAGMEVILLVFDQDGFVVRRFDQVKDAAQHADDQGGWQEVAG